MRLVTYLQEALLVQAGAEMLRMPHETLSTALIFLHRSREGLAQLEQQQEQEEEGRVRDLPAGERMASACLFLAAKVEESSVRTNDLLNAVRHLARRGADCPDARAAFPTLAASLQQQKQQEQQHKQQRLQSSGQQGHGGEHQQRDAGRGAGAQAQAGRHNGEEERGAVTAMAAAADIVEAAPGQPAAAAATGGGPEASTAAAGAAVGDGKRLDPGVSARGVVVGDAYYDLKEVLILDEQLLLRVLRFDVLAPAPPRSLLNFAATLGAPRPMTRLATCLANDALLLTDGVLRYGPECLAACALHLAASLLGILPSMPGGGASACWKALGLDAAAVARAASELAAALIEAEALGLDAATAAAAAAAEKEEEEEGRNMPQSSRPVTTT